MAEAADETSTTAAPRLSLTQAFLSLLRAGIPQHRARLLLEDALFGNDARLYRDGALVDPLELAAGGFYVCGVQKADGARTITMATNAPQRVILDHVDDSDVVRRVKVILPPEPHWEVDAGDFEDLLQPGHPADRRTFIRDDLARRIARHEIWTSATALAKAIALAAEGDGVTGVKWQSVRVWLYASDNWPLPGK